MTTEEDARENLRQLRMRVGVLGTLHDIWIMRLKRIELGVQDASPESAASALADVEKLTREFRVNEDLTLDEFRKVVARLGGTPETS